VNGYAGRFDFATLIANISSIILALFLVTFICDTIGTRIYHRSDVDQQGKSADVDRNLETLNTSPVGAVKEESKRTNKN
jgi:hypothetical protein